MKRITNNLDNTSDLSRITNAIRSVLANKECNVEVIIQERKESRRLIQNALYWHWIAELMQQSGIHGMDKQELINFCKWTFGIKIVMKSNPDLVEKMKKFAVLDYESKVSLMEFIPVTSIMKVSEMALYLTEFKLYWSKQGVHLTDKEDMINKAIGQDYEKS